MTCSKQFSIEVTSFPDPLAWWTMDLGTATSETDSVNGINLTPIAGGGFMTIQAGKILNSYQQASSPGQSVVSICSNALLSPSGTQGQTTIVAWVNLISNNGAATVQNTGIQLNFTQGGISYTCLAQLHEDGLWKMRFDSGSAPALNMPYPGLGVWHFVVFTYDTTPQPQVRIGVSINGVPKTTALVNVLSPAGAITTGQVIIGTDANDTWVARWDEVAIFDGILTDGQIDYLWNSGAGRTYPP